MEIWKKLGRIELGWVGGNDGWLTFFSVWRVRWQHYGWCRYTNIYQKFLCFPKYFFISFSYFLTSPSPLLFSRLIIVLAHVRRCERWLSYNSPFPSFLSLPGSWKEATMRKRACRCEWAILILWWKYRLWSVGLNSIRMPRRLTFSDE